LQIGCIDSLIATYAHEKNKRYFLNKAKSMDETKTAMLQSVLHVKVRIILKITTNVDIPDGLYNGAWGFLQRIDPLGGFAEPSIGKRMRNVHSNLYKNGLDLRRSYTPIFRLPGTYLATSRPESTIFRWQFPVRPATAETFHHNQGLTLERGAVNFRGPKFFPKMAGRHYVGYSRFSKPEGHLFVLDSTFEEIYVDSRVHSEMARLRAFSRPSRIISGLDQVFHFPATIQCILHNTRSLTCHIDDIRPDENLLAADLLIFTETQIKLAKSISDLSIPAFQFDVGESSSASDPMNVWIYQKQYASSFERIMVQSISCKDFTLKYDIFMLPGMSDCLQLISLYRSPHPVLLRSFFQHLRDLLSMFERFRLQDNSLLIVCGDFNIDLLRDTNEMRTKISFFQDYFLHQYVRAHKTDFGSLLDYVWSNLSPTSLAVSLQESFWSDHVPILVRISL
jgi:hypothetical protein